MRTRPLRYVVAIIAIPGEPRYVRRLAGGRFDLAASIDRASVFGTWESAVNIAGEVRASLYVNGLALTARRVQVQRKMRPTPYRSELRCKLCGHQGPHSDFVAYVPAQKAKSAERFCKDYKGCYRRRFGPVSRETQAPGSRPRGAVGAATGWAAR